MVGKSVVGKRTKWASGIGAALIAAVAVLSEQGLVSDQVVAFVGEAVKFLGMIALWFLRDAVNRPA